MYKYIKPYKDLTNHKILGQIENFESLNFNRYILINFETNQHLIKNNFSLLKQTSFLYNDFLKEKLIFNNNNEISNIKTNTHLSKRRKEQLNFLNKKVPLRLMNFKIVFDVDIWNLYVNLTFIKKTFSLLEKFFSKIDETLFKNLYVFLKKFFINFKIRMQLFNYNVLKFKNFLNFYQKWYKNKSKIFLLYVTFLFNFIKKTKNKMYLKYNLTLPIQIFIFSTKFSGLKNLYGKSFFLSQTFLKFSNNFFIEFFLKNFEKKLTLNTFFKYQKFFKFWKRLHTLYFKLNIRQLKFKYSKTLKSWKVNLIF